jgi:hypothetical protein
MNPNEAILQMLQNLTDTVTQNRKEAMEEHKALKRSIDTLSERVNVQNGRIGKIESTRVADREVRKALSEDLSKRQHRAYFWITTAVALIAAVLGSTVYVLIGHLG